MNPKDKEFLDTLTEISEAHDDHPCTKDRSCCKGCTLNRCGDCVLDSVIDVRAVFKEMRGIYE